MTAPENLSYYPGLDFLVAEDIPSAAREKAGDMELMMKRIWMRVKMWMKMKMTMKMILMVS